MNVHSPTLPHDSSHYLHRVLRIVLPKGSLERATFELFEAADLHVSRSSAVDYKATIDDPNRFKSSKAVAAHIGLTPRVYQSGEIDRSGNISKCGDKLLRHELYEAANSHLRISKKNSVLKAWGLKVAKRIGNKKALVAVARKLAIIMHRMWVNGSTFQHSRADMKAAA